MIYKITQIMIIIVGVIHAGLAFGEIFFGVPLLVSRFDFTQEVASQANSIVQNAGLYNSFIAAGLFWSAFSLKHSKALPIFFLVCVTIAGIFGAFTLKPTTLIIQTIPALIALILVGIAKSTQNETFK